MDRAIACKTIRSCFHMLRDGESRFSFGCPHTVLLQYSAINLESVSLRLAQKIEITADSAQFLNFRTFISVRFPSHHNTMRRLFLALGLVSVTLALPPRASDLSEAVDIVQHSNAELLSISEVPRLQPDRPSKRHEHHDDEETTHIQAHTMEMAGEPEEGTSFANLPALSLSNADPTPSPSAHSHGEGGGGEHDHHHSREPPKLVLDEAEILKTHSPDPPSYFDLDKTEEGMPGTMIAHVVLMSVAYFVLLPLCACELSFFV